MSRSVWPYEPTVQLVRCPFSQILVMFWDVNPILWLCEVLSCTFTFFCIIELFCLVFSERVARRVMISGVWPSSYVLYVLCFRLLQGLFVRLLAWKWSVFRGNSVRFVPEFR